MCVIYIYIYPAGPYFPRIWPQHKKKYKGKKHSPEKQVGLVLSKIWPQHKRFARARLKRIPSGVLPGARARTFHTDLLSEIWPQDKKNLCRGQVLESTGLQDIYISKSQSAIWTSYHPHAYASLFHSSANVESVSPAILRFALGSHCCNFPIGLAARKGLRRATFLCPKRVPKTKKKVASKNPKPKGKLLSHCVTRT